MQVLKVGRDLDIAVALEVMDYIWITHWLRFSAELAAKWIGTVKEVEESGGVYIQVKEEEAHSLKLRELFDEGVPCFSTQTEAAMELVKHLEEKGYTYQPIGEKGAVFSKGLQEGKAQECASQAEAICIAALSAVRSV